MFACPNIPAPAPALAPVPVPVDAPKILFVLLAPVLFAAAPPKREEPVFAADPNAPEELLVAPKPPKPDVPAEGLPNIFAECAVVMGKRLVTNVGRREPKLHVFVQ